MHKKEKYKEMSEGVASPTSSEVDTVVFFLMQTLRALRKRTPDVRKKLACISNTLRFLRSQITFSLAQNPFYN